MRETREELKSFWFEKRVFITGHTGFKGTWLVQILHFLGAKCYGYSKDHDVNEFSCCGKPCIEKEWIADIRNMETLADAMQDCKPDAVIHLASHSTLNQGNELSRYIFETNTMGVVNILEAIRGCESVKVALIVTSDKCYKNEETMNGYSEDSPLGAKDPYSTSKAIQELVTECYRNSFLAERNICIATARASNVIGGGDFHYERLVPGAMKAFANNNIFVMRKPNAIRPWQNVLDVLEGYIVLCKRMYECGDPKGDLCSSFNFGPKKEDVFTVIELIQELSNYFDNARVDIIDNNIDVPEAALLLLNCEKAHQLLDWVPRYSLKESVGQVALFTSEYYNNKINLNELCSRYIEKYFVNI